MRLPIFPSETKLINNYVGVHEQDGTVYYSQNGVPIHCHLKQDMNSYRYITAMLVVNKLCKASEIADALWTCCIYWYKELSLFLSKIP